MSHFSLLSPEVNLQIQSHLNPRDISQFGRTARAENQIATSALKDHYRRLGPQHAAEELERHRHSSTTHHTPLENLSSSGFMNMFGHYLSVMKYPDDRAWNGVEKVLQYLEEGMTPGVTPHGGTLAILLHQAHELSHAAASATDTYMQRFKILLTRIPNIISPQTANQVSNIYDVENMSALHYAVAIVSELLTQFPDQKELMKLAMKIVHKLVKCGADVNALNQYQHPPLVLNVSQSLLDEFIGYGADLHQLNLQYYFDDTPDLWSIAVPFNSDTFKKYVRHFRTSRA